METSKSELLKSVVIRFKKRRNKLLIPKSELDFLEVFLKKNISDDIVVINLSGRGDKDLQNYIDYFKL
mgnify:CR=1 FL=1